MPLLQVISTDQEPARAAENASETRSHERGFGRYLLSTSMFLLVMYCVPFCVVRWADFDEISNTPYSLPAEFRV